MLRHRAQQHPQVRLPRIDFRLQYRTNYNIFYGKLKVTEPELMAITDMTRPCWSIHSDIAPHMQCAAAIAYLTSNSHQQWLASGLGMSQATVSRKFIQLINFLSSAPIVQEHVKYPTTTAERAALSGGCLWERGRNYHQAANSIRAASLEASRKHFFIIPFDSYRHVFRPRMRKDVALNVLVVCDARGKVLFFDATSPGSYHDARVLQESELWAFEEGRQADGYALIGDKAFPNKHWLMPAHKNPPAGNMNQSQTNFNKWQCMARAVNENVMRRLKAAFPILGRIARITPETLSKVIASCIVLYNVRFAWRYPYFNPHTVRDAIPQPLIRPPNGTPDPRAFITAQL